MRHDSIDELRHSLARLDWTSRDLYIAAISLGDIGTIADVELHVRTGDHLSPGQISVLHAAAEDAVREDVAQASPRTG